jgi:hypothetical protein
MNSHRGAASAGEAATVARVPADREAETVALLAA